MEIPLYSPLTKGHLTQVSSVLSGLAVCARVSNRQCEGLSGIAVIEAIWTSFGLLNRGGNDNGEQ